MKRIMAVLFAFVLATGTIFSNGSRDVAGKKVKIGFAIKSMNGAYFVTLTKTVKDLCEKNGWGCSILDTHENSVKETEAIETFISQGTSLIFLDAVEPSSAITNINKAADAGIPVINLDSGGVEKSEQCTTIYSDNKQNGRKVGLAYTKYLKDNAGEKQTIISILLSGNKGNTAGKERRMGLFAGIIEGRTGCSEQQAWIASQDIEDQLTSKGKAVNKDANFEIRGQGWGNWTREEGLVAAEDFITANKDVNMIMGENDQMMFGGIKALENAGLKNVDVIAAADGAKEAYDLIKKGGTNPYISTGENSPYKIAEKGMKIAKEILVDGKKWRNAYPPVILTEAVAVTKDNVDERYFFGF
jgi:ribose transport system substrate-binding protein